MSQNSKQLGGKLLACCGKNICYIYHYQWNTKKSHKRQAHA